MAESDFLAEKLPYLLPISRAELRVSDFFPIQKNKKNTAYLTKVGHCVWTRDEQTFL